jgi:hypothetical protein
MEKKLEGQLCRKCRAALTDSSSTSEEEDPPQLSSVSQMPGILDQEALLNDLSLVRDYSSSDPEWGSIGRYFCLTLFCLAVVLISSSVQPSPDNSAQRQVSRLLVANSSSEICSRRALPSTAQPKCMVTANALPSTLSRASIPMLEFGDTSHSECTSNFWKSYL